MIQKKHIEKKTVVTKPIFVATLANIAVATTVVLLHPFLPPEVPVFYGLADGRKQLADSIYLVMPVAISLGFIFINTTLSALLKDNFLKNVLTISSIGITIFSTFTIIRIILLVGAF